MPAPDRVRRVQGPILLAGAVAAATLGFISHAPNRLLSGKPIDLPQAATLAGKMPVAALILALVLLLAPLIWPGRRAARWTGLLGAGLVAACAAWFAGDAAAALAAKASSPSARTSLGGGFWAIVAAVLLMASDTVRRLRLSTAAALLAAVLVLGPLAGLLGSGALGALSLLREYAAQRNLFAGALLRHCVIVLAALAPTVLFGFPLGVLAQRRERLRGVLFPVLNVIQTIPSIALFGLLIGPLSALAVLSPTLARAGISGIGLAPAIVALVLYSLLPVVRNTVEGLDGVPREVVDAASGMGMTEAQSFWRVQLPLAAPVLLSGLRVTAVQAVGLAAVTALIGAGGLGAIMFQGLFANALDLVLLGALPVILLAAAVDMAFRVAASLVRAGLQGTAA